MIRGRFICTLLLGLTCLGATGGSALAAPGDVDRTFGREGVVALADGQVDFAAALDMAIAPDDSIYVLRRVNACPAMSCVMERLLTRLRPGGSIDSAFGSGGTTNVFGPRDQFSSGAFASLALSNDGKIIVAAVEQGDLLLARVNGDGSLDGSFGQAGIAKADLGIEANHVRVAVQGDGRLTIAADAQFAYRSSAVAVARYTPQGAPDPTFNGGAPVLTTLGSGFGGLGIVDNEKTLLAGPHCCELMGNAVHVARLDAAGLFDSAFAPRGQRFIDGVAKGAAVSALLVLPNGRIVIIGSGTRNEKGFALRLLPDGRLDRGFGHRGIAYMPGQFFGDLGVAVDEHRRLVLGGTARNPSSRGEGDRLALLRRLPSGRQDRTFGGGGPVRLHSSEAAAFIAIGMQSHDRPVALAAVGDCFRACPSPRTTVVRYLGGISRARCLGQRATIVGTRNADRLVGTPRHDVIAAGAGNDVVRGRGRNDLICGGRGNDRLIGGGGKDRLLGGAGRNQIQQ